MQRDYCGCDGDCDRGTDMPVACDLAALLRPVGVFTGGIIDVRCAFCTLQVDD